MKALIINTVCKTGSTGALTYGFYKYLVQKGDQAIVCYGRGAVFPDEKNLIKIGNNLEVKVHAFMTRVTGLQGFFSYQGTRDIEKIIVDYNPDVVYLLNIHGYYLNEKKIFKILAQKNLPTVYIMPDEYPFLGKCCFSGTCEKYKKSCVKCPNRLEYPKSLFFDQSKKIFNLKKESYKNIKNLAFVSVPYNIQKAKQSALISTYNMYAHDWGIDLKNLYYPNKSSAIKKKYGIPEDKKIILAVASFNDVRKGIKKYFFESAKQINDKNTVFVNIGYDGNLSVIPENFIPIKYLDNQEELTQLYSVADLFVITSMADTMPLAALIALGCGTPVCGFNISGIKYLKASNDNGCVNLVDAGNIDEIIRVVKNTPEKKEESIKKCRDYALQRFLDTDFYKFLYEVGNEMSKGKNGKN